MKKYKNYVICLIVVFLQSCKQQAKNDTPEGLAMLLVDAVNHKDEKSFLALAVSKPEVDTLVSNSILDEQDKVVALADLDNYITRVSENANASFKTIIETGEKAGIDWYNAEYDHCKVGRKIRADGIERDSLEITIKSSGQNLIICVKNAVKTFNGWKLSGRVIYGTYEDEEKRMEGRALEITDSINTALQAALKNTLIEGINDSIKKITGHKLLNENQNNKEK